MAAVPRDEEGSFFALAAIAERGTSSIAPRPISDATLFVFCVFLSVRVAFGPGPGDANKKSVAASVARGSVARGLSTNRTRGGAGAEPEPAIGGARFAVDTRSRIGGRPTAAEEGSFFGGAGGRGSGAGAGRRTACLPFPRHRSRWCANLDAATLCTQSGHSAVSLAAPGPRPYRSPPATSLAAPVGAPVCFDLASDGSSRAELSPKIPLARSRSASASCAATAAW